MNSIEKTATGRSIMFVEARDCAFDHSTPGTGLQAERAVRHLFGQSLYSFDAPVGVSGFGDLNCPDTYAAARERAFELVNELEAAWLAAPRRTKRPGTGVSLPCAVVFQNYGISVLARREDSRTRPFSKR